MEIIEILCAVGFGLIAGVASAFVCIKRQTGQMKKVSSTGNFEDILENTIPGA